MLTDNGFLDALNVHKANQSNLNKSLEGLPIKYEKFTFDELTKIIKIRKQLGLFKSFDEVIKYLDSLNLWKSKFSTGSGVNSEGNNDSLYYLTDKNISLRIKKANLVKGLNESIEPFMESSTFSKEKFYPSDVPIIGLIPEEYSSEEFYQLQNQEKVSGEFISKVPKFYKDGKLFYVGKPKNLYHEHPGNVINKIYFIKNSNK